jgi:hypothetical protein
VGKVDGLNIQGNYTIAGAGNRLIADRLDITGDLTVNGNRLDVGVTYGSLSTTGPGTLTMTSPSDQVYVGQGGASFGGGSTVGKLTAGTMYIRGYAGLLASTGSRFAASGTHTVVFGDGTTPMTLALNMADPANSFPQNVVVNPNATMVVSNTGTQIQGLLSRGAGAATATISSASRTLTVKDISLTGGPTTINTVGIIAHSAGTALTLDNVSFTGYSGFSGHVLTITRVGGGPYTFNNLNFSGVGGFPGVFIMNAGNQTINVLGSTPSPGVNGTHYMNTGGGTVNWP